MLPSVLIIEDNADIARLARLHLAELPAQVHVAVDGLAGFAAVEAGAYDVIVLDLHLPGKNGLDILRWLGEQRRRDRVIVLSGRTTGLPDDLARRDNVRLLAKPFRIADLVGLVRGFLTGSCGEPAAPRPCGMLRAGALAIDPAARQVTLGDRRVDLSDAELDLLLVLAERPGVVIARPDLMQRLWPAGRDDAQHLVTQHVQRLRAKIEPDPAVPRWIVAGANGGYALNLPPEGP